MINLYRLDHLSQVVSELEPQVRLLEGLFGCRRRAAWHAPEAHCRGVSLEIPGTPGTCWNVVAPTNEQAALQEFLHSPRGPGLHHVAAEVTDLDAAAAALRALGATITEDHSSTSGRWLDVLFGPADDFDGFPFRLFATPHLDAGAAGNEPVELAAAPPGPTLGIRGLLHICQATADRDALARWYDRALGMREIYRTPQGAWPDMATSMLSVPGSSIIWELIQPEGDDSHVQRFLDRKGAGCHHLTLQVEDWDRAMAACAHYDVPTFGVNEGETDGALWRDNFIHPKHTGGVLVQLYWEQRPGVWARSDKIPATR